MSWCSYWAQPHSSGELGYCWERGLEARLWLAFFRAAKSPGPL